MKRGYYYCVIMFLVVLASFSVNVEGVRPLKDDPSSSSSFFLTVIMERAYSGPSHRGRGH